MFVNVAELKPQNCGIIAFGHTEISDDPRFRRLTQTDFIRDMLSHPAKSLLLGGQGPWPDEDISVVAEKWIAQTGISSRIFFSGKTTELGAIAAKKCLQQAGISAMDLDIIIGGSNTGPGYASLADHIKLALGARSKAMAYDLAEACPVGSVAIFNAWSHIRSGVAKKVLVVCSERATTLAPFDDWKGSNLFGDAAFACLLTSSEVEAFKFFDFHCEPFDGQIDMISKSLTGFTQNGLGVHRFVGKEVVRVLVEALEKAKLDPAEIDHLVSHQPSAKTLDFLFSKLEAQWTDEHKQTKFRGLKHRNVEHTGNTSGASTGSLISLGIATGQIKKQDFVLVTTFGAGLSIGSYGLRL